jgi:hypothetical protein
MTKNYQIHPEAVRDRFCANPDCRRRIPATRTRALYCRKACQQKIQYQRRKKRLSHG